MCPYVVNLPRGGGGEFRSSEVTRGGFYNSTLFRVENIPKHTKETSNLTIVNLYEENSNLDSTQEQVSFLTRIVIEKNGETIRVESRMTHYYM